ncbi:hypothetical protein L3X38_025327 [Prunus dulcis]|uniref:Uncharacterized protein n=1 Tax=Prunus dulcis TaxID=3755 RepID=A0AAD4W326_PRUDU|nr:hypothetical protein L3X38_025327 [Prunus dulcis]
MFQSHKTTKSLTWHAARKSVDGHMSHPADSPSCILVDDKWPEFGKEPRNLRLALSSDGFNPHNSLSSRYSCSPVIKVTYNLPQWLTSEYRVGVASKPCTLRIGDLLPKTLIRESLRRAPF